MAETASVALRDLVEAEREAAVPLIRACFTGYYRWHAKRTLREISRVRAHEEAGVVLALSMLERLVPEVGYVFYLAVAPDRRGRGLGGALLDDALELFRRDGAEVVYGAVEEDNEASLRLFRSRGFRPVARKELGFREGGLGAWGLRSRMRLVPGELLLGLRLKPASAGAGTSPTAEGS